MLINFVKNFFVFKQYIKDFPQIANSPIVNPGLDEVMTSWTKQKGHPVVHVSALNNTHIILTQQRFVTDSTFKAQSLLEYNFFIFFINLLLILSEDYFSYSFKNYYDFLKKLKLKHYFLSVKWHIPFTYSIETLGSLTSFTNQVNTSNLYDKLNWVEKSVHKIIQLDKELKKDSFILGNLDMSCFYRVNYDVENWHQISKQLQMNHKQLSARTRAQLVSDSFSLSQATMLDADLPLELIKYLSSEFDYLPWNVFLSRVKFYTDMLGSSQVNGDLQSYLSHLVEPYYKKLGWDEDLSQEWLDRYTIIFFYLNHPKTIQKV